MMKTSFLKNFFNSKDMGPRGNFNIHSVDLDDSDDVIVCNESFFQRNNSQSSKEMLKSKFNRNDEKKVNLFSLNESSVSDCEIKSPLVNNFNLKKIRDSPLNSPLFDRDNIPKSKNILEFVTPASMNSVLKTPKKDDKINQFQSFKSKGLSSPSMKFFGSNNANEIHNFKDKFVSSPAKTSTNMSPSISKFKMFDKNEDINISNNSNECHNFKDKLVSSPAKTHTNISPSIAKFKMFDKNENINHKKISSMFCKIEGNEKDENHSNASHMYYKNDTNKKDENINNKKKLSLFYKNELNEKYSNVNQNHDYMDDKPEKEIETYDKLNTHKSYNLNPHESLDDINELLSDEISGESSRSINTADALDLEDSKLQVLHMKLKLESEKIQKWKENIEKELLQKSKKVSESNKIIESLRSSNLDLQMRQENISLNYREEIECRSEVSKKIENSRQLCNILKEKMTDIEDVNLNYIKENEKIKNFQDHILCLINFVSDDFRDFSQTQVKILKELKNKVNLKEKEIENITLIFSEEKSLTEIETEKYNTEIKSLKVELLIEKENLDSLKIEKDQIFLDRVKIQELLANEKELKESLLNENVKLVEDLSALKVISEINKEENLTLAKEIDLKENNIIQLNANLNELNAEYSKYKLEFEDNKVFNEIHLIEKEEVISKLANEASLKTDEINALKESLNLLNDDMNTKISFKDASILDLSKSLILKDEQIFNLEDTISKLNEEIKEMKENFNNLKLQNDLISKNSLLLKSNNQELQEELNNRKVEINAQSEEIRLQKNDLAFFKNSNNCLREGSENNQKLIDELQNENSSLKSELKSLKLKLTEMNEMNHQLKMSMDDLNDTNKFLMEEKNDDINHLTKKYDHLILIEKKLDSEIELKSKECKNLLNDLNIERVQNADLMQTCENLRVSLANKERDLVTIVSEKTELSTIYRTLTTDYEEKNNKIKDYESFVVENKSKISSLEAFVEDLSKDKQNILKSREDLRKELMFTLEQCKNEHDVLEKKRNKEIENLKAQINSLSNNSSNSTKKSKNKINDLQSIIAQQKEELENLQKDLKNVVLEKNTSCKNFEMSNLLMKELSEKISVKDKLLCEIDLEKQSLKNILSEYESKINFMSKELNNKSNDILKLKEIEMEYREMKNNIITNSPPVSTQIPDYIKTSGSATPKSQRLFSRLQSINAPTLDGQMIVFEKQTPQKTPKGILRQPGSASKRRKVIFEDSNVIVQNIDPCDDNSLLSDGVDIDLEDINFKNDLSSSEKSPTKLNIVTTPKKANIVAKLNLTDSRSVGRLNNIRKTPSKAPSKLNDKRKKSDKNWFDSDNFFGVSEP